MPYIGRGSEGFGIRERYQYTATSSQTAFTGSDINSKTLAFDNGSLVDVLLNGVVLKPTTDYNTSTANTVTLVSGASTSDEVMIIVYDVFALSDAMPKTGGTFSGAVTHTGAFTSVGIDDNADATTMTIDTSENVGIGNTSPSSQYMTRLVVGDGSGTEGITIYSGNDSSGRLEFSDATSGDGRYAGGIVYEHNNNKLRFNTNGGNERLGIDSGGDVTINAGDLIFGTAGKGINLGVTSATAANTLHDYEEGTFTPRLYGLTTGSSTAASQIDCNGTKDYYKIGSVVFCGIYFQGQATSTQMTGGLICGSFPFTANGDYMTSSSLSHSMGFPGNDSAQMIRGSMNGNDLITFSYPRDNTSWLAVDAADAVPNGTNIYFRFCITYGTDS